MKKIINLILFIAILSTPWLHAQDDVLNPYEGNATSDPSENLITESYQIPSYNLYLQDWNNEYLKIKSLGISFGNNDDIKIILVESHNNAFAMPCDLYRITSKYGNRKGGMHTGIDLALAKGAPIRCCFDGVVRMAKEYSSYGKTVVVRHYNGLETVYAHLDSIYVQPNEMVRAGQQVGTAGNSGRASGVHLHFETRFLYEHFDPEKMIDFGSGDLISNILTIAKSELDFDTAPEAPATAQTPAPTPTPTPAPTTANNNAPATANNAPATTTTTTNPTPKPATQPAPNNTANNNNSGSVIHTVVSGDTLYGIARKYGTTVDKLLKLNNITEDSKLQLGQKIRVK